MFAVIFKAEVLHFDDDYAQTAARLRELALTEYGCVDFISLTEGQYEITISYWQNEEQILRWKNNVEHTKAQELGRTKWYKSWHVQVVEVMREYNGWNG